MHVYIRLISNKTANHSIIYTRQEYNLGNEARFPNVITTVQCSICSQLNNKPRVVVTDFRLRHTCSTIILLRSAAEKMGALAV